MKLILATTLTLFGVSQAKLEYVNKESTYFRWRFGDKCVSTKIVNKRTFNSIHLKDCDNSAKGNASQRFYFKNERIESNDGKRCLYFNEKTKLYAMASATSEKYCVKSDDKSNRFADAGSGKMRLKSDSKNCILPQIVIHKKFNKIVNGPECPTVTNAMIKDYGDRKVYTNAGQTTYVNIIYNIIASAKQNGSPNGYTRQQIATSMSGKVNNYDEPRFNNTFDKMISAGTVTEDNNKRFTNTKEACDGKGPKGKCDHKNKGAKNYPKMIFKALQSQDNSWKSLSDVYAIIAKAESIVLNTSKVDNIIKKAKGKKNKVLESNGGDHFRLVDPSCKKGLNGSCDKKKKN